MASSPHPWSAFTRQEWRLVGGTYRKIADDISAAIESGRALPREEAEALLIEIRDAYASAAAVCDGLAEQKRKAGRPRVRPRTATSKEPPGGWPSNALMPGYVPLKPKAKRGRPVVLGPDFDRAAFRQVEALRAELASSRRSKPTIKAAIDALNERDARYLGKRVSTFVAREFNSIKAAYQRGKKLEEERSKIDENLDALKSN